MATLANGIGVPASRTIGIRRLALTGALSTGIFYVLCWSGAALGIVPVTHMYLQLFSDEPMGSTAMVFEGAIWSVVFGLLAGALVAVIYNALAFLDRR